MIGHVREWLDLAMFLALCGFVLLGFPVSFTLAGTALIFGLIGMALGVFDVDFIGVFPHRIFGVMTNEVLIAVPLFIFMGVMLERSKVAEELLDTMGQLFGRLRGGLGISVSVVGALLAASTGIVGATVITMGLLSLPTMLRRGYDPRLACGSIAAAGTLGQIIPPSIVLVVLGDQISNAHQEAQRMLGNFSPEPVGVGDLFAGALIPGLALVGLYILYQIAVAILRPGASPAIPRDEATMGNGNMAGRVMHALVAPLVLIISVLGSILVGIATPTEAAGVGAIGAVLLAGHRLAEGRPLPVYVAAFSLVAVIVLTAFVDMRVTRTRITDFEQASIWDAVALCLGIAWGLCVALIRVYRNATLVAVTRTTARLSSMIFVIILAAQLFSLVFRGLGGDDMVHEFLSGIPGGAVGAMLVVMALMFVMGFFLDTIEILFIVVPIVGPVLLKFGFDPIWLGIMIAVNLQTSFLTPPLGYALFYLRSVAPPEVTTMHIYRGVVPFVCLQLLMLVLLSFFPAMATWLPHVIFR
jgi:tripartite ATP-independent transporter DctM subunit